MLRKAGNSDRVRPIAEKLPEMLVFRNMAHEFGRRGEPAAGVIVVILIEIVGDFLDEAVAEDGGVAVKHDGPVRGVAGRLGEQPLVEDGQGMAGGHAMRAFSA